MLWFVGRLLGVMCCVSSVYTSGFYVVCRVSRSVYCLLYGMCCVLCVVRYVFAVVCRVPAFVCIESSLLSVMCWLICIA